MTFLKRWKKKWDLQSFTQDELFELIVNVIIKQLDEIKKEEIYLSANLVHEYDADSVDIVAMLLSLEEMFKNASSTQRTLIPTDQLGQIVCVEDILDIMYEVLIDVEEKMDPFIQIFPDLEALTRQKKIGELYSTKKEDE